VEGDGPCVTDGNRFIILSDNYRFSLSAATPRVWAIDWMSYVNTTNKPTEMDNEELSHKIMVVYYPLSWMEGRSKTMHGLKQRSWYAGQDSHRARGCAMIEAGSRRPLTAEKRVQSQASPCEICGG
jgi:hypothetical protein